MSLGAFEAPRDAACKIFYLDGKSVVLFFFAASSEGAVVLTGRSKLNALTTLDEHLQLYLGAYQVGIPMDAFENAVVSSLKRLRVFDELLCSVRPESAKNIEIDFIGRSGARICVGEIKQKAGKRGLDQLNTAVRQNTFGPFVTRIFISGTSLHPNDREVASLLGITVVELNWASGNGDGPLSQADETKLRDAMTKLFQKNGDVEQ